MRRIVPVSDTTEVPCMTNYSPCHDSPSPKRNTCITAHRIHSLMTMHSVSHIKEYHERREWDCERHVRDCEYHERDCTCHMKPRNTMKDMRGTVNVMCEGLE